MNANGTVYALLNRPAEVVSLGALRTKASYCLAARRYWVGEISQAGVLIQSGKRRLLWALVPNLISALSARVVTRPVIATFPNWTSPAFNVAAILVEVAIAKARACVLSYCPLLAIYPGAAMTEMMGAQRPFLPAVYAKSKLR